MLKPTLSRGALYAIIAAALFGSSTPFAKQFLHNIASQWLAGLLYLGAGIGLALQVILSSILHRPTDRQEAPLRLNDLPRLLVAIIFGGIAGPWLLMIGLTTTPAANASLLLNLEAVLTALIAWIIFRENWDRRIVIGMLAITIGCIVLTWSGSFQWQSLTGSLCVLLACACWAIDNNLTRAISAVDPKRITMIKGIIAGSVNIGIAVVRGLPVPDFKDVILVGIVGWGGYGISLVLFVLALRNIGTARTGAFFSIAPFVGVAVALLFDPGEWHIRLIPATILMIVGIWLHLTEKHQHLHTHTELVHEHSHSHDEHHAHHPSEVLVTSPHTHKHHHSAIEHSHLHYPDLHHRHDHTAE